MLRKYTLNLPVGLAALLAEYHFVVAPLYRLLHLGVRPHGSLADDSDFYYSLVAVCMIQLGGALGITLSLCGIACAFGTPLGFDVSPAARARARTWFWYLPFLWFAVEILGHYQIQRWYADHGVLFPLTSFLREFAPHVWWWPAVVSATVLATLTGRGFYQWLSVKRET